MFSCLFSVPSCFWGNHNVASVHLFVLLEFDLLSWYPINPFLIVRGVVMSGLAGRVRLGWVRFG